MPRAQYYTTAKIGPTQEKTPEGFLLCRDVALARTGMMIYGPDETPVPGGPDGITKIFREAEDLFSEATVASAQGKDVTDDHPDEDVTPANYRELTCGVMLNVRRGDAAMDDLLLGDLLVKEPGAIQSVQDGKREVSLGYEADYEETGEGVGRQSNIIINHVALVEQGRCGPRCAIKDHKPTNQRKEPAMAKRSKILDALMRALKGKVKDADLEEITEQVQDELGIEEEGGDIHIHIDNGPGSGDPVQGVTDEEPMPGDTRTLDDEALAAHIEQNAAEHAEMSARLDALEALVAELSSGGEGADPDLEIPAEALDEIPEELKEQAAKTGDSVAFGDSFKDTVAMAEILVPGIRVPTFDGKAKPGATYKAICGLRRSALDAAYQQQATHGIVDTILGGKPLDTSRMTCDAIRTVFRAAAAARRASNNDSSKAGAGKVGRFGAQSTPTQAPRSLADINRRNAEHYSKQ